MRGNYIDNMKKNKIIEIIKDVLNEGYENTTMMNLIKQAEKDGHISGMRLSADDVMSAAKEIGDKWDKLHPEEQKVFRDTYYNAFINKIKNK
jgi:hypothetical protein